MRVIAASWCGCGCGGTPRCVWGCIRIVSSTQGRSPLRSLCLCTLPSFFPLFFPLFFLGLWTCAVFFSFFLPAFSFLFFCFRYVLGQILHPPHTSLSLSPSVAASRARPRGNAFFPSRPGRTCPRSRRFGSHSTPRYDYFDVNLAHLSSPATTNAATTVSYSAVSRGPHDALLGPRADRRVVTVL